MQKKYLFIIAATCVASVALIANSIESKSHELLYTGDTVTVDISAEIVPRNAQTKYAMHIVNDDQLRIEVTSGVVEIKE